MRPGAVKSRSGLQRMPPLVGWSTIEELHDSRVERIFGARDEEPIVLGELLENIRSVSQVVCGGTNVVPNASKNDGERLPGLRPAPCGVSASRACRGSEHRNMRSDGSRLADVRVLLGLRSSMFHPVAHLGLTPVDPFSRSRRPPQLRFAFRSECSNVT